MEDDWEFDKYQHEEVHIIMFLWNSRFNSDQIQGRTDNYVKVLRHMAARWDIRTQGRVQNRNEYYYGI